MQSTGFHQVNMVAENLDTIRHEVLTKIRHVQNIVADNILGIPQVKEYIQPLPPRIQTANSTIMMNPEMQDIMTNLTIMVQGLQQSVHANSGGRGGCGGKGR